MSSGQGRAKHCPRPSSSAGSVFAGYGRSSSSSSSALRRRALITMLLGLDRHGHGPVARPVLGIDGVVLDGRVEPQAVALLAVVEGALERLRPAAAPAPAAPSAAPAPGLRRRRPRSPRPRPRPPRRPPPARPRARRRRARRPPRAGRAPPRRAGREGVVAVLAGFVGRELVLSLEGADVADGDLELVGDPGVGAALPHPGPDLVQLWFERSACQAAADTTNEGTRVAQELQIPVAPGRRACLSAGAGIAVQAGEAQAMLVLTRKVNQSIMIGDEIEVSVLAVMGEKVRIGIEAPRSVPVFRKEVYVEIQEDRGDGAPVRLVGPKQPVGSWPQRPAGRASSAGCSAAWPAALARRRRRASRT